MTVTSDTRSDYGKDFLASPYPVLKQILPLCIRLVGLEFAAVEIEDEDFIVHNCNASAWLVSTG